MIRILSIWVLTRKGAGLRREWGLQFGFGLRRGACWFVTIENIQYGILILVGESMSGFVWRGDLISYSKYF